jgi:ABC-2 type transport system ATP-binding protein
MSTLVETKDLSKRYGATLALDRLNLTIPQGAIYGFIGPNGAGKTTTMRILTTLLEPSAGEAFVAGVSVHEEPKAVRKLVGFMPDFFGVYDSMRSWEYLDFFAASYGIPKGRRLAMIDELLALVDLSHKRDDYVMGLSRGMKQRLSLARTMAHDPRLLILDEPASGLDPRARIELRELLKELRAMGKTIMISSHILTELAEMCTHIGIIEHGRLLASGDVATILRSLQPHKIYEVHILAEHGDDEAALALMQQAAQEAAELAEAQASSNGDAPPEPPEPPHRNLALDRAAAIAREAPGVLSARALADGSPPVLQIDFTGDDAAVSDLLARLIAGGVRVTHFAGQVGDLEDIFLKVTDRGATA